jgi:hypothetical protein
MKTLVVAAEELLMSTPKVIPDVDCRGGAIRAALIAFPVSVLLWTLIGCVWWALRHV